MPEDITQIIYKTKPPKICLSTNSLISTKTILVWSLNHNQRPYFSSFVSTTADFCTLSTFICGDLPIGAHVFYWLLFAEIFCLALKIILFFFSITRAEHLVKTLSSRYFCCKAEALQTNKIWIILQGLNIKFQTKEPKWALAI